MIYKASLDKTAKIVTVCVSFLLLLIVIFQAVIYVQYQSWPSLASIFLLFILYIVTYLYSPRFYKIESNNITVHRAASNVTFLRSEIKNIQIINGQKLRGAIRTFGVGGMFGYFGQFLNAELGCMTWYATQRKRTAVLIEMTNNKKIIVTPDEPEQFIKNCQT